MQRRILSEGIADLTPGYFALVMATGIVSIAAKLEGLELVAWGLLWFNLVAYAVLWLLTGIRIARYGARIRADLFDHGRGPGFFTTVAGTAVLGAEILVLSGRHDAPWALWSVAVVLWFIILYAFFTAVTVKRDKPGLEEGLNGVWLVIVVATQSLAVLGALLAVRQDPGQTREVMLFFCLCAYLLGCMLYLVLITLIIYRFTFLPFTTGRLTPPYWVNMGAVAITTLAGANLLLAAPLWPFLASLTPFLRGFTLFFWAAATWWIPLLLILGIWRHGVMGYPIEYGPLFWGLVFPLGMYTTATYRLSVALELPFLRVIPRYFVYIAMGAWAITAVGLVRYLVRTARQVLGPARPGAGSG